MWRTDSLEKSLMLGKTEGGRRRGRQRMRRLDGITDSMDMSLSKLRSWWWTGRPGVLQSMGLQGVRHDWATELNWRFHFRMKFLSVPLTTKRQAHLVPKHYFPQRDHLQVFQHDTKIGFNSEKKIILTFLAFFLNKVKRKML